MQMTAHQIAMPTFAILPRSEDFIFEVDAEFFNSQDQAFDAAFDWSVELNGTSVKLFRRSFGKWVELTSVFA